MQTTLVDGPETGRLRVGGRRPYLQIGAVIVFAAAILMVGYLGPRPVAAPSASPGASAGAASPNVAAASPSASASASDELPVPSPAIPPARLEALLGATLIQKAPGETVSLLPLQISSRNPAIVGNRLFYVVGGDQVETNLIGAKGDPFTLVSSVRCKAINQIAASGDSLMFLLTWPEPPNNTTGGCDTFTRIDWSLQIMNIQTGHGRELASGVRGKVAPAVDGFPIHFAISTDSYAFDRPDSENAFGGPETVEVHSLDGKLLWTTRTAAHVAQLSLAGGRLAVVTQPTFPVAGELTLWVATGKHPALQGIGSPATGASMSTDGRYLAWDLAGHSGKDGGVDTRDVLLYDAASGATTSVAPPAMTAAEHVLTMVPTVVSTASGPFVAWLVVVDTTVYPMYSWPGKHRAGFLDSVQQPVWIAAGSNSLTWIAESSDGWSAVVYSADLSKL